jgi:CDP-4-dehydro-6-deoxyglucose reductase, E1
MSKSYWLGKVEQTASHHKIQLVKSSFYNESATKQALADFILSASRLSMGEHCLAFEKAFAEKQQREFAVFVSSGSMANLLLVQALINTGRLKPGDKIGFSALTWPTNVMPLIQLGLVPVPLDCNPDTLNVSPEILEQKADELNGFFITNVLGFSDDIVKIKQICEDKNIVFFEDNCESLGSKVDGTLLGNFGVASTFSFFVGHHMSTVEGGMICTDDSELHRALVMGRAHGWDRNLEPEEQDKLRQQHGIDEFYSRYTFYDLAYNARPSEINGFLGNQQIGYFDEIVDNRHNNFMRFSEATKKNPDFITYDLAHMDTVSNFAMPLLCIDKDRANYYKQKFTDADVEIRPVIAGNMTKQPFYMKYMSEAVDKYPCPNSDTVHSNGFYFGNNAELTPQEVDFLVQLVEKA